MIESLLVALITLSSISGVLWFSGVIRSIRENRETAYFRYLIPFLVFSLLFLVAFAGIHTLTGSETTRGTTGIVVGFAVLFTVIRRDNKERDISG